MKKILIVVSGVILLAAAYGSKVASNPTPAPAPQTATPAASPVSPGEIRFTGTKVHGVIVGRILAYSRYGKIAKIIIYQTPVTWSNGNIGCFP